jgi:hypothetical protein
VRAGSEDPQVVTVGTGWHEQLADRAEIDVCFAVTGKDRAGAVRALGRIVAAAEPALTRPGLVVRSRRLRVHTEWHGRKPVGCRANEDIALVLTDLAVVEDVLGSLIAAEPASLDGPRWTLGDPAAALREAQIRAVADARRRAEGYAAALGGTLGALQLLTEAADHGPAPMVMRAARTEAAPVDVQDLGLEPEPVRVTARCTTTWAVRVDGGA